MKRVRHSGVHEKGALKLMDILESVMSNPDIKKAGALAIFVGIVRENSPDGKVEKLKIDAYKEEAEKALESICEELVSRRGVIDVRIHHFVGEFNVGEDLVYVVTAGTHRKDVFSALREAVERYKKEAPIFKKEIVIDRSGRRKAFWVGEDIRVEAELED